MKIIFKDSDKDPKKLVIFDAYAHKAYYFYKDKEENYRMAQDGLPLEVKI